MMKIESIYKHILEPSGNGREISYMPQLWGKKIYLVY